MPPGQRTPPNQSSKMGRLLLVPYIREVIRELIKANAFEHLLKKEVVALGSVDICGGATD